MDDLEFRRAIYADPFSEDAALRDAMTQDESKRQVTEELRQLNAKMAEAAKVAIPDGLAERLILRQSIASHRAQKRRTQWHIALAASIAFVFGVSFTMYQQRGVDLGEHALAHVYHTWDHEMKANEDIPLQLVNSKLATFGGQFEEELGRIYSANYCTFEKIRSLHLVMQGDMGKVSVFIVPKSEEHKLRENFYDGRMMGSAYDLGQASMVIVGEKGEALEKVRNNLQSKLNFSA